MKIFTNLISKRIKNGIGKGSSILLLLLCCVVASAQQVEVTLTAAGTLSEKIATDQKYAITSLKVSGPINGTDVRYLREMAGRDYKGYSTSGKLAELDLIDANIVEGGDSYYNYNYTKNNVLGYYIFKNCNLTSIKLPNSVTRIGDDAFYDCSSLSSVTIPNSVTSIGDDAFYNCYRLSSVTIPNSVTSIGDDAFYNCLSLSSVTIPNSVTSIGDDAFRGCSSLSSVTIPNSVTSIGDDAFRGCSSLSSVTIPNSVTSIGDDAFRGCSSLSSVTIPNSVTSIGSYAFYDCSSLSSITVPSSVISIGSSAFSDNLKKVIMLPNSAPSGLSSVFGSTSWYGMFYVANNNYNNISRLGTVKVYPHLSSLFEVDGVVYVPVNPSQRTCDVIDCNYSDTIDDIVVPETVSYKGVAMYPQNVNEYSFINSKKRGEANLSNNGTIGDDAFKDCENLTSAVLSNSGSVGDCALSGCSSLKSVVVGDGVPSLGNYCFSDCKSLSELTLSDNVTEIGNYAFSNSGLKTFSCPSELTSLGYDAFYNCKSLTEVKINGKLTALSSYLFSGCSSLEGLSIPANVKSVGDYAFKGCTSFATLVIENDTDVLALGSNYSSPLFVDCPLDSVYVGTHISYNTSSSYGYSPFYRNATLCTVSIGDNVREVYDNEFYGCTGLKTAIVGENVAKIGNYAFSGCSSMESFLFGKMVESIGNEAFSDCTALTTLVTHRTTPPTCGTEALDDINKWNCTLYVPTNSLAAYQAADQWKEFFFIEEGAPTGIHQPISGTESTVIRRYDASGRSTSSPVKGLNILKMSDGTTKKVLVK